MDDGVPTNGTGFEYGAGGWTATCCFARACWSLICAFSKHRRGSCILASKYLYFVTRVCSVIVRGGIVRNSGCVSYSSSHVNWFLRGVFTCHSLFCRRHVAPRVNISTMWLEFLVFVWCGKVEISGNFVSKQIAFGKKIAILTKNNDLDKNR